MQLWFADDIANQAQLYALNLPQWLSWLRRSPMEHDMVRYAPGCVSCLLMEVEYRNACLFAKGRQIVRINLDPSTIAQIITIWWFWPVKQNFSFCAIMQSQ